jgi:hypothetical protein
MRRVILVPFALAVLYGCADDTPTEPWSGPGTHNGPLRRLSGRQRQNRIRQ